MQIRSTTCLIRSRRRGLTLIEVVAALAILGTLLVGIVLAQSRHTNQLVRARAQAQAVEQADQLIAQWWTRPQGVPIGEEGVFTDAERLRWQTRLVNNKPVQQLGARVVRVEVFDTSGDPQRQAPDGGPLVVVDLVIRDPEVEAAEREAAQAEDDDQRGADDV